MNLCRTATVLLIGSFIAFDTTCGGLRFGVHSLADAAGELALAELVRPRLVGRCADSRRGWLTRG